MACDTGTLILLTPNVPNGVVALDRSLPVALELPESLLPEVKLPLITPDLGYPSPINNKTGRIHNGITGT